MTWLIGNVIAVVIPWRFDPASARDMEATIALRVRVRTRVTAIAIAISDGACEARVGPAPDAAASATIGLADLIRLVLGDVGWPQLLSRGRFEMSGDPFLAMRLPAVFRLSVAARGSSPAGRGSSPAGRGSSPAGAAPRPASD